MAVHAYQTCFLLAVCCLSLATVFEGQSLKTSWTKKQADVYFLVDSSSTIWIRDYRKMLKFVANLVSYMDIGPTRTRVGLGIYAKEHIAYIPINNTFDQNQLQDKITTAPHLRGMAYISRALHGMTSHLLAPSVRRLEVPLIAVLLTDGTSMHRQLTRTNAAIAKNEGIFIFTVGIGREVDRNELLDIASDPKSMYTYQATDFEHLTDILPQLSLSMSEVEFLQNDEGMCSDAGSVDVVFVFDESALGERNTLKVKAFIASLVEDFSMNSGKVRVGMVSKLCKGGDTILGQYVKREDFIAGLQTKAGLGISDLVNRARLQSFMPENGARYDAKYRIVLILHSDIKYEVFETAQQISKAKYDGIGVFVVQLGTDYSEDSNRLASDPTSVLYSNTADDLSAVTPEARKKFLNNFC